MKPRQWNSIRLWAALLLCGQPAVNGAQTPPALLPTLTGDYTLTYHVVVRDVRTPQMRQQDIARVTRREQETYALHAGTSTPKFVAEQVRQAVAEVAGTHPPQTFTVTVSERGGMLYYQSVPQATAQPTETVLYDGQQTLWTQTRDHLTYAAPGLHVEGLRKLYRPGVNLPGLPLARPALPADADRLPPARAGVVPCLVSTQDGEEMDGSASFLPGAVFRQGAGAVTRARIAANDYAEEWAFSAPQRFRGLWIAGRAHWTRTSLITNGVGPPTAPPSEAADFAIISAQAAALAPARFTLSSLLRPGARVVWVANRFGTVFTYNPHGGSLAAQARATATRQAEERRQQEQISKMLMAQMKQDTTNHGDGRDAHLLLSHAAAQARAQGKNVFLVFGSSWCGGCFLMHHYLDDPQVTPLIDAHYVVLELDVFEHGRNKWENPGGQQMLKQYGGTNLIPFFAVLTPSGHMIANANVHGQDMGMPTSSPNAAVFLKRLRQGAPCLGDADVAQLRTALKRATFAR